MDIYPVRTGAERGGQPPAAGVRAEILASWERSQSLGIDSEGPAPLPVESDLDPDSRLLRAAAPVLERLWRRFAGLPVTVTLADSRANIVDRRGDTMGLELMDAASLVPGANVDERFMGTSSVSMVLSTRAPFVVVGHEHFLHNLKALTCMAAPVRDPVGGTVQGAVNLSVPEELAEPGMALLLQDATERIADRLLELSTARERSLVHSFLQDRDRGAHARIDLHSGELAGPGAAAPPLARQERRALLEAAVQLISSTEEAFAEVTLAGGRVAALRRRQLRHGDAEGAAVEVTFPDVRHSAPVGTAAPGTAASGAAASGAAASGASHAAPGSAAAGSAATATAPDGRQVPLLHPPGPAGPPREEPPGPPVPATTNAPVPPLTERPETEAAATPATGPGEPGSRPDAWLLLVGEPGVGRLAAEARARLSLLNEAGVRIGTTLDMRRTAEELAAIAVPRFADLVVVDLVEGVLAGEEPPPGPPAPGTTLRRTATAGTGTARTGTTTAPTATATTAHGTIGPTESAGSAGAGTGAGAGATTEPAGDSPASSARGPGEPVSYPPGTPQARCLATGRPVADSVATAALAPAHSAGGAHPVGLLGEGVHAYLAAPLCARGAVLGLAGFYRRGEDRPYEEDDLTLAAELAARAAMSVENARRFGRERNASLTLQRSLLPRELPRLTGVDLASRYLPAGEGAGVGVGGDWFDAIPLSGLRVALVVGDVAGHGLQAAATMGRLRTAVRTLAGLDLLPEEVLAHLDDLVGRAPEVTGDTLPGTPPDATAPGVPPDDMDVDPATAATCLYAVYDPVSGCCTAARAGHPPPAVVAPEGTARLIDLPAGPPLGLGGLQPYESATVELEPGSLLALYTDGLLKEDRGYGISDTRLDQLMAALGACGDGSPAGRRDGSPAGRGDAAAPLEPICDRITGTLLPDGPRDDVALLLARVHALPGDRVAAWELPAEPSVVATARSLVRRQLEEWDLEHLEFTTGLVVSELVTNAVRYGGRGPVSLRLLRNGSLICEVSDHSNSSPRIRRAATTEEGGRGLFLVAQFTRTWGARYMQQGKTVWAEQVAHAGRRTPEADEDALLDMFDDLG
ncbi:SpoIIE family protein phosphatase [Streptomyces sp. NRRL S-118]|uniref:SpoIIE family protein phosphatase n=1 Tax=Streptomyces sp. NRRL S-118 TaxID=1463881 RepID=UPI0005879687|nr:SpoIIE family protein phosphatase [Streptomyces sp. NRRL S-118]